MKIAGKEIKGSNVEIIVIPRNESEIVLKAQAVQDYTVFDKMNPEPKPSIKMLPGGVKVPDFESLKYKTALMEYSANRVNWMIIKSLEISAIEWDTVDLSDPKTWGNYLNDFKKAGFIDVEINRIITGVMTANCLNDSKIEEARKRFLTSPPLALESTSTQEGEPATTPSGESVSVSA